MENDAEQTTERKVKIDSCDNRKKEMQCSFEDSFYHLSIWVSAFTCHSHIDCTFTAKYQYIC